MGEDRQRKMRKVSVLRGGKLQSLTQEIDLFSKIWWRGNGGTVVCGDVNLGDLEASDWRNILSIVEKSDLGIKLIPIKKYLNSQIENALRYADWERKRKFIEDD